MKYLILVCVLLSACSTGNKKADAETADNPAQTSSTNNQPGASSMIDGCYLQVVKRDSIAASLQQQGNSITGSMSFNNFEKDASTGTVSGELKAGILRLYYTFNSEGMQSVMELYFKYKDGSLIQGYGDMNTRGDTAYFVNSAKIQYSGSGLNKIPCEQLPAKYK